MAFFGKKPESNVPAPKPVTPGKEEVPRKPELSTLDFTAGGDVGRALANAAGAMEIQEVSSGMSAAAEEAAVLYANGSMQQAEQVLNGVLESPDGAHIGEGLWMMLLDLYRLTGQRARFESRVIDYATRFEKSPPPWEDLSGQAERRAPGAPPLVNLAGTLSGQVAQQFGQIEIIGRKSGAIRIDLGKLRGVDDAGCTLLWTTLSKLAAGKVKVSLVNCGQVLGLLEGRLVAGRAECQDGWLLLLELLQHSGEHDRFEQWAVDYAITFEVSPPSWEGRAQLAPSMATAGKAAVPGSGDPSCLEGELTSATPDVLRRLAARASEVASLEVDCTRLRRIDFVSAGTLFNILASLQAQGRLVVLHNVNAMVAALLRVMAVDQVAQVDLRG
jgi:ABC-type transporter Mla MlaB component